MLLLGFVFGLVAVFGLMLWLAARHHRRTWGNAHGVMKAEHDREPQLWLGQQRD